MEVALESNGFFIGIEYLATFCCGMVGGLAAVRKGYDIFAILVTTWLTALGGGIIRDVLLGALPPAGVSDKGLVITALLAAVAVAIIYPEVDNSNGPCCHWTRWHWAFTPSTAHPKP